MRTRGINPIIATIFLVGLAVVVSVLLYTWLPSWISGQQRMASIQVTAKIVLASDTEQINIGIKNVGTVKLKITKVRVETENTALDGVTITGYGVFDGTTISGGSSGGINVTGLNVDLDPGQSTSGTIVVPTTGVWQSGSEYMVTITYQDVDTGKTLTETITVRA